MRAAVRQSNFVACRMPQTLRRSTCRKFNFGCGPVADPLFGELTVPTRGENRKGWWRWWYLHFLAQSNAGGHDWFSDYVVYRVYSIHNSSFQHFREVFFLAAIDCAGTDDNQQKYTKTPKKLTLLYHIFVIITFTCSETQSIFRQILWQTLVNFNWIKMFQIIVLKRLDSGVSNKEKYCLRWKPC